MAVHRQPARHRLGPLTPLLQFARDATAARPGRVHLVAHDGSTLAFGTHPSKRDRGDDRHLALLVDAVAALGRSARSVHVVDREADSVGHWRRWHPAHVVPARADDRRVLWNGRPAEPSTIRAALRGTGAFRDGGAATDRGTKARLFVAETAVVPHRPARTKTDGRSPAVPGRPLSLRPVPTAVRDEDGRVPATWWRLTNAPADWGTSADVARRYHFRWRIGSTFERLESAGRDLEAWRQRTGAGLRRTRLVALGGCVRVWRLESRTDASAEWLEEWLEEWRMRRSGRQVKRRVPVTTSGLLAGLWVWPSPQAVIGDHGADTVERLLADHLPLFAAPPNPKNDV